MAQHLNKTGKDLNATFLPNTLIRKNENKMLSSLASKYQFQKTTGNAFIFIDPPEIKFSGYELDKSYTTTLKIINRAPVQQRITILPPEEPGFTIKTNKRGNIAPGMSENITVIFKSNEFKYQHDVIRITSQTQNFVVPLYAYPTLPDLRSIFPKLIDFGAVEVKETSTFYYPIKNIVPLNFEFEFIYHKQCQEIIISPLKGLIASQQTITIEISFHPNSKVTSLSEVVLSIKQFDFQPLNITIMGNGTQKVANSQSKRIKSSKLAPLKDQQAKKTPTSTLRRRPSGQATNSAKNFINPPIINNEPLLQTQNLGGTFKKTNIRTNYAKLINTKKSILHEQDIGKTLNPAKIAEKEYLNRYNRVQQLDKQKEIKFDSFLGDKPMNEGQIQLQRQLAKQIQRVRSNALQARCQERYSVEKSSQVPVQYKIVPKKQSTWDDKKNDELSKRRQSLLRFKNAGSQIILKYRLLKRLGKIKEFLSECNSREDVRKKVQESHAKALDQQQGFSSSEDLVLNFDGDTLMPNFFPLQFQSHNQNQKEVTFKPEGKCTFDDLKQIKSIAPHKIELLKFSELTFAPDYFNHNKFIPKSRASGQQEYVVKSSGLPQYDFEDLTEIYALPPKATAHHFIYDDFSVKRYKNYVSKDQKDPEVYLEIESQTIEDQFEGWTGGQHQILKAKFTRNLGCQYNTFSSYSYSSETYKMPALVSLGQDLPFVLEVPNFQDTIQEGDSDQQKISQVPVQTGTKLIELVQAKNEQLKDRRAKGLIKNPQKDMCTKIQKNIKTQKDKALGQFIGKIREANRWIQRPSNRFLI